PPRLPSPLALHDALPILGLDQQRDFTAVFLDRAADGPAMVIDGRVAALWGGGIGWPGFTAIAAGPAGARFIAPDPGGIQRIQARERKSTRLNSSHLVSSY